MPKLRGFNNPNRVESQIVNLEILEAHFKDGDKVCLECLLDKKLIGKRNAKVKILGDGEISKKLEITGELLLSASAKKAIEKAGGKIVA